LAGEKIWGGVKVGKPTTPQQKKKLRLSKGGGVATPSTEPPHTPPHPPLRSDWRFHRGGNATGGKQSEEGAMVWRDKGGKSYAAGRGDRGVDDGRVSWTGGIIVGEGDHGGGATQRTKKGWGKNGAAKNHSRRTSENRRRKKGEMF